MEHRETGPLPIGAEEIRKATDTLRRYKAGKANLEKRLIEDELWWELRHWEAVGRGRRTGTTVSCTADGAQETAPRPKSTSAWLFSAIASKHADAMDSYPEPVALPRERSDEESAELISAVLPVVLEQSGFEQIWSDQWWEKLKHGTAVYSVLWDAERENGLGDIAVAGVDLLRLFWEPGVTDLQDSRNLFLCELRSREELEARWPALRGKLTGRDIDIPQYLSDDAVDVSDKSVVVDWYYKRKNALGRTVLHYVKYCGETVLFASENDPRYRERGWYDHGLYPFFADVLFPEAGTPVGFGFVAVCKDPQIYVDQLFSNVLETSVRGTKRRYFISEGVDASEREILDENSPFIHVSGPVGEDRLRELTTRPLDSVYLNVIQLKIDELNKTAGNRDVSNGSAAHGVTAASAIAALQEAGSKTSRDMIAASYRTHAAIARCCVELMRQFYTVARTFRITNRLPCGYAELRPGMLAPAATGRDSAGAETFRRPVFDIRIRAQKRNPFSRAEQNERAKELFRAGFFDPRRAQEAQLALDMMDFEGIEQVRERVAEGQTLYRTAQELGAELARLRGQAGGGDGSAPPAGGRSRPAALPGAGTAAPPAAGDGMLSAARSPRAAGDAILAAARSARAAGDGTLSPARSPRAAGDAILAAARSARAAGDGMLSAARSPRAAGDGSVPGVPAAGVPLAARMAKAQRPEPAYAERLARRAGGA